MKAWNRLFGIAALGLISCGESTSDSGVQHTLREPLRDASPVLWADISPEAMMALLKGPSAYLPADDSAVVRLQYWLDLMSDHWRSIVKGAAAVPRPRVIVERRSGINAFVSQRLRCYQVSFQTGAPQADVSEPVDFVRFFPNLGAAASFYPTLNAGDRYCEQRGANAGEVAEFFGALNRQLAFDPDNRCRFRVEAGVLKGSVGCPWQDAGEYFGANSLVVPATSNVITVHSGSFAKLSEPEMVAMLAHELGHFFKADVSRPHRASGFFYELGPHNSPRKPIPTRNRRLLQLGAALTELNKVHILRPLPGQKFFPNVLFDLMASDVYGEEQLFTDYLQSSCSGKRCEAPCGSFVAQWNSEAVQLAIHGGGYPDVPEALLSVEEMASYRALEESLAQCAAQVDPQDVFAGRRDARQFVERALSPDVFRVTNTRMGKKYFQTLLDVLNAASKAYVEVNSLIQEGTDQARTLRLGWYTHEQEADDFALEQLVALGIAPEAHLDLLWKLMPEFAEGEESVGTNDISLQECRAAAARGWRTEDGDAEFVPLGPWGDAHHGNCYRIFNAVRELKAHHYRSKREPLTPPGGTWEKIQAHVQELLLAPR